MITYPEQQGIEYAARPFNMLDLPTIPAVVHWRLDCATTGTVLQDWTQVLPTIVNDDFGNIEDVYVTIEVSGLLNAIQDRSHAFEEKILLVVSGKDTARSVPEELHYRVKRLQGFA